MNSDNKKEFEKHIRSIKHQAEVYKKVLIHIAEGSTSPEEDKKAAAEMFTNGFQVIFDAVAEIEKLYQQEIDNE